MVRPYALVADADLQRGFSYRQLLAEVGVEAVMTRDGQDALNILARRGAPALALIDLSLPKVDGIAVIARLRAMAPPEKAPVLAFSGFDEIRAHAYSRRGELGIAQVLPHGVPSASLRRTIERLLDSIDDSSTQPPPSIEQVMKIATAECLETFPAAGAIVYVRSGPEEWLRCDLAASGAVAEMLHGDSSLLQSVLRRGDTFIMPEHAAGDLLENGALRPIRARGFVGVPLAMDRGVFGVLALADVDQLRLDAHDIDALHAYARRLAVRLAPHIPAPETRQRRDDDPIVVEQDVLQHLAHLALSDTLTGLANRRAGELAIQREIARAWREGTPLSFVLLDVDEFKRLHDEFGPQAGDDVLNRVARIIEHNIRGSDLAVRWSGEEFLLVLPNVTGPGAAVVAERIRTDAELTGFDHEPLTVSAGVAELEPGENINGVLGRADARLSQAKRSGRNRVIT